MCSPQNNCQICWPSDRVLRGINKNKHPERPTERYVVAQVHVFKLGSWEQEKFQTEIFINHQTQISGNPVVLHEQIVCLSSVSSFLFSSLVWVCTAPSMLAYRNTLVITQRERWRAEGIMKREETILAGSFFILQHFLMSGQLRVQRWGSRKWREKKKQMKIPQPQQQKPQTNQETAACPGTACSSAEGPVFILISVLCPRLTSPLRLKYWFLILKIESPELW